MYLIIYTDALISYFKSFFEIITDPDTALMFCIGFQFWIYKDESGSGSTMILSWIWPILHANYSGFCGGQPNPTRLQVMLIVINAYLMDDFDAMLVCLINHFLGEVTPKDLQTGKFLIKDGSDGLGVVELQKHSCPKCLICQLLCLSDRLHCHLVFILCCSSVFKEDHT